MRVAFDSRAKGDPRGIGRYVRCLLEALGETAVDGNEVVETHRPRRSDVFHAPWLDVVQLRSPCPMVVTIHDLVNLKRTGEFLRTGVRFRLRYMAVQRAERGCSGMAGTFGLKKQNYRNSLRAGWPLISAIRESTWQAGTTECSACKMQMEQGSSKPTIHPLKLLALAYDLMPEVSNLLTARGQELVVT